MLAKLHIIILIFGFMVGCSNFTDKYQSVKEYQKKYKQARRKTPKKSSRSEDFDYFNQKQEEETIQSISCPYIQSPDINYGEPLFSCPSSEFRMYWTIQKQCLCIPKANYKDIPTLKEILRDFYY
ncbi:MAG: hypothetical protein H7A23_17165 [Leptospiraceae bacterium]|nr:hypothetical protein [Leptospiraceae bacterium]